MSTEIEPTPVMMTATCRTPGCPVEDVGYVVAMYGVGTPPIYQASCARCEHPVTDLVPVV